MKSLHLAVLALALVALLAAGTQLTTASAPQLEQYGGVGLFHSTTLELRGTYIPYCWECTPPGCLPTERCWCIDSNQQLVLTWCDDYCVWACPES